MAPLDLSISEAKDFAVLASSLATCVALIVATRNLRLARRTLNARAHYDALEMLEGDIEESKFNLSLLHDELENALHNRKDDPEWILCADPTFQDKMKLLVRAYDKIGLLVKYRAFPYEYVFDFYSRPIVMGWLHLSPLVKAERERRNQPGHCSKFEILAVGAALHRKAKAGEQPPFYCSSSRTSDWAAWINPGLEGLKGYRP